MFYFKSFIFLFIISFAFSACGHKTNPKYVALSNNISHQYNGTLA